MFNFYSYEVVGVLDKDIIKFCKSNNIGCSDNGKIMFFAGEKEDLQKLHDEFFDDYEFNIEEVKVKEI